MNIYRQADLIKQRDKIIIDNDLFDVDKIEKDPHFSSFKLSLSTQSIGGFFQYLEIKLYKTDLVLIKI